MSIGMTTTMNSKVNIDGTILFEQPFLRVPYETLRKHFRNTQKHIEREFGAIQSASAELAKPRLDDQDPVETAKVLDGIITRVEGLKKRLLDIQTNHVAPTQVSLRQRLDHLTTLESAAATDQPEYIRWTEARTDRWLVDWALRNSRDETALTLAREKGLELLVDTELFAEIRRVEDALREQKCAVALAWCSENKAALKKMKNSLEFELRLQEYIEIVQQGKTVEAMAYLKKHLIAWYESHPQQCKQAAALLVCPPSMGMSTYKELYDPQRWSFLIRTFRHAAYALYNIPTTSLLALGLSAGLSSLKLPSCYDPSQRNVDCPVCDTDGLGVLAKEVPWSHHVNSVIVCRITGKIMDGDNPPLCLPNGQVYSQRALEEQAAKNNGQVTCPKTGDVFSFHQTKKMFIF
ncbi:CTLH/CRA C-terminal to lish motif domain-containing protein [Rhizoctonia solani]|nr:CTLH/CRA C-terminal to lish motif domain-containing protein [Rhizoctonia solani]